jgi:hypothetical protein
MAVKVYCATRKAGFLGFLQLYQLLARCTTCSPSPIVHAAYERGYIGINSVCEKSNVKYHVFIYDRILKFPPVFLCEQPATPEVATRFVVAPEVRVAANPKTVDKTLTFLHFTFGTPTL